MFTEAGSKISAVRQGIKSFESKALQRLNPLNYELKVGTKGLTMGSGPADFTLKFKGGKVHPQTGNPILSEIEYGAKTHQYENPGTHDPTGGANSYNPTKSVLPENHVELFESSVPVKMGDGRVSRFATDADGNIHRFQTEFEDLYHYNGSTNGVTKSGMPRILKEQFIPIEIRRGIK